MSNQKAAPPIPIQPKPISEKGSAGASGQMAPVRKQRAGPLVFVNSSDVNTEGEKRGNRKMVKKWAMLNRVGQPLTSQNACSTWSADERYADHDYRIRDISDQHRRREKHNSYRGTYELIGRRLPRHRRLMILKRPRNLKKRR